MQLLKNILTEAWDVAIVQWYSEGILDVATALKYSDGSLQRGNCSNVFLQKLWIMQVHKCILTEDWDAAIA